MDAIETLMGEHRVIERGIDALTAFADEARRRTTDDREELGRFVTFIREFADACHHAKEEDILFKAMVEAGFPSQGGPIAVMLAEHDEGRRFVKQLGELAAAADPWGAEDRQRLADAAHGYADLLHQHIHKEDTVLYPMAEAHLPPQAMEQVEEACRRHEEEKMGSGEHERLHQLAEELVARHLPALPRQDAPHAHG